MKKLTFVTICILVIFLSGCKHDNSTHIHNRDNYKIYDENNTSIGDPLMSLKRAAVHASISDAKVIGYSKAILCGVMEDEQIENQGFIIYNSKGEIIDTVEGTLFENEYYIKLTQLNQDSEYKIRMYGYIDDERVLSSDTIMFTTPKVIYEKKDIVNILEEQINTKEFTEKRNLSVLSDEQTNILTIQQFMKLLNLQYGKEGKYNLELQLNQLRLEYSFNSYGRYVYWDNVDGVPDSDVYDIVVEILQTKENYNQEDFIYEFIPAPHALVEYNLYNENGGQMDSESYIYDMLLLDDEAYKSYQKYPFIYDTDEFKQKYAELVEKNENGEYKGYQIEYSIAKNKAVFALKNDDWLREVASPLDRTILIAEENQRFDAILIVQAAVAYSYLYMEMPTDEELEELSIQCGYRSYDVQRTLYSKKTSFAKVVNENSGAWHCGRQVQSYVPGFSNHQYAIAMDVCNIFIFRSYNLYPYFQENAQKYGFYNYYVEPWHWVYLGE